MRFKLLSAALIVAASLAPAPASAQTSDTSLGERVIGAVQGYAQFGIFDDVSISVENHAVRLMGRVTTPSKRDEIGKRVAKIDGVRTLTNDIQVLPTSRS